MNTNEKTEIVNKGINVAYSWIVTLPKDFKKLNQDKDTKELFDGNLFIF